MTGTVDSTEPDSSRSTQFEDASASERRQDLPADPPGTPTPASDVSLDTMEDEFDKRPPLKALRDKVAQEYCINEESTDGGKIGAEFKLLKCRLNEQLIWFDIDYLYPHSYDNNPSDKSSRSCAYQAYQIEYDILSFKGKDSAKEGEKWLKTACTSAAATALKNMRALSKYDKNNKNLPEEHVVATQLKNTLDTGVYDGVTPTKHNIAAKLRESLHDLNHNCAEDMYSHDDSFPSRIAADEKINKVVTPKYILREYYKYGENLNKDKDIALLGRWWDVLNAENNIKKYKQSSTVALPKHPVFFDVTELQGIVIKHTGGTLTNNVIDTSKFYDQELTFSSSLQSNQDIQFWDNVKKISAKEIKLKKDEYLTIARADPSSYSSIDAIAYSRIIRRHPSVEEKVSLTSPSSITNLIIDKTQKYNNDNIIPIRQIDTTCNVVAGTTTKPYDRSGELGKAGSFFDHSDFKVPVPNGVPCQEGSSGQKSVLPSPPLRSDNPPRRENRLSGADFETCKIVIIDSSHEDSIACFSQKPDRVEGCSEVDFKSNYCQYGTDPSATWRLAESVAGIYGESATPGDMCVATADDLRSKQACVFTLPLPSSPESSALATPLAKFLGIKQEQLTTCAFDLGDGKKSRDYVQYDLCASSPTYYTDAGDGGPADGGPALLGVETEKPFDDIKNQHCLP